MYNRWWYYVSRSENVSQRLRSSSSPNLISYLARMAKQSLKSFMERTIPGPLVKVSTSVHRLRNLVKNYCKQPTLAVTSMCWILSTVGYKTLANCCWGCTYAWIAESFACASNDASKAECSFDTYRIAIFIKLRSRLCLITIDSARNWLILLSQSYSNLALRSASLSSSPRASALRSLLVVLT